MKIKVSLALSAALAAATLFGGDLTEKIGAKYKVTKTDEWFGGRRTIFDFQGYDAWVVEPPANVKSAAGNPWTWTMQWRSAYVARTSVPRLLKMGWHHVSVDTFKDRMDENGLKVSKAFQDFLVKDLGFAPQACLIGMSWGGFFSTRYAATYPECVKRIFLDCPLLNFTHFQPKGQTPTAAAGRIGPWAQTMPADGDWSQDARMPVNLAEKLVATRIPITLRYGGQDQTVPKALNSELFIARYKKAGGTITVIYDSLYGHHPHGVDLDNNTIINFFTK